MLSNPTAMATEVAQAAQPPAQAEASRQVGQIRSIRRLIRRHTSDTSEHHAHKLVCARALLEETDWARKLSSMQYQEIEAILTQVGKVPPRLLPQMKEAHAMIQRAAEASVSDRFSSFQFRVDLERTDSCLPTALPMVVIEDEAMGTGRTAPAAPASPMEELTQSVNRLLKRTDSDDSTWEGEKLALASGLLDCFAAAHNNDPQYLPGCDDLDVIVDDMPCLECPKCSAVIVSPGAGWKQTEALLNANAPMKCTHCKAEGDGWELAFHNGKVIASNKQLEEYNASAAAALAAQISAGHVDGSAAQMSTVVSSTACV